MAESDKRYQQHVIAVSGVEFPDGSRQSSAPSGSSPSNSGTGTGLVLPTAGITAPDGAATGEAPSGLNPSVYVQDALGQYHAAAGIDTATTDVNGSGPLPPAGILTWFRNLFIRDSGSTQGGKNALVSINHTAGLFTDPGNQDRALWVSNRTPPGDSANRYGIEAIQVELDINGSPNFTGSPDSEASAGSFQVGDAHSGNITGPTNFGVNAVRAQYFRNSPGGNWNSVAPAAIRALVTNNTNTAGNGAALSGILIQYYDNASAPNVGGIGLNVVSPVTGGFGTRFALSNRGIVVGDHGTNASDYNILSVGGKNSGRNWFQGPVICGQEIRTAASANSDLAGQLTLSNGTASYTFNATYASVPIVVVSNTSSLNPLQVTTTLTGFTVTGTGSDVVNYICVGRN